MDDDVVVNFVYNQLDEKVISKQYFIDYFDKSYNTCIQTFRAC